MGRREEGKEGRVRKEWRLVEIKEDREKVLICVTLGMFVLGWWSGGWWSVDWVSRWCFVSSGGMCKGRVKGGLKMVGWVLWVDLELVCLGGAWELGDWEVRW